MDELMRRFLAQAPVAVMVRATLARALADSTLDELFARTAQTQYTRELAFSTLVQLLAKVTFGSHDTVHAAYRHTPGIPVSITAVYDKLQGIEPTVVQALVAETAQGMASVCRALPVPLPAPCAGLRLRTLDGNFLAGTEHRLACLRDSGAAALPGMSLVVREGRTGLLTDLIACEDAYTNERSLSERLLPLVAADDLWLADRNFCTLDYLGGIAQRQAFFLVRHHAGSHLHPEGERRYVGSNASGDLYEHMVQLGGLRCRCIVVRLFEPLRDGSAELRLLTNVAAHQAGAGWLAEVYRTRWQIETAFQELTESLCCEVRTLGYPKAALFAFALAVVAYNVLVVIRSALASAAGADLGEQEWSSYHLATEVAVMAEGMAIALPESAWQAFAVMTPVAFAQWLQKTAAGLDRARYRKNKRGPKKPVQVKRTRRGAHRSTARALQEHKNSP